MSNEKNLKMNLETVNVLKNVLRNHGRKNYSRDYKRTS